MNFPVFSSHIANYAFNWCSSLTNVTIGKCVSNIGSYAFSGCSSLISIKVSENNNKYLSLNGLLLSKDGKNVFQGVNGIVVVPEGVTNICSNAFYNLFSLKRVTIPNSVTNIGSEAFSGCYSLSSITIPENVLNIGYKTFNNCSGLKKVVFTNPKTSVYYSARTSATEESFAFLGL